MFRSKAILYLPVLILVSSMGCSPNPEAQSFFGQILIGPDKSESSVRLPLIAAGDSIYVDANDDGKPDDSELLANGSATVVTPENSKSEFSVTAELAIKPELASETLPQRLNIVVNVKGDSEFQMKGSLELAIAPDDNHWLHFGGPMQLHTESEYSVRKGDTEDANNPVRVYLGTTASGSINDETISQTESPTAIVRTRHTAIVVPDRQPPYPDAIIEFAVADGEPIEQQLLMDHFC